MDEDLLARLQAGADGINATRAAVTACEPWPLAATFDHSDEARWGPPEVLAHVAEMLPYWLGEVERILAGPPEPVPFGRVGTDPVRVAIIGRDRTLPVGELYTRIGDALARWTARLKTLSPAQLDEVGLHPRLGEMRIEAIIERQVVGHLAEHVVQLEELVEARSAGS
jgi:hypothetical protein